MLVKKIEMTVMSLIVFARNIINTFLNFHFQKGEELKGSKHLKECKHFERPLFSQQLSIIFSVVDEFSPKNSSSYSVRPMYQKKFRHRNATSGDQCISIFFCSLRLDLPGWLSYTAGIPGRAGHQSDLQ